MEAMNRDIKTSIRMTAKERRAWEKAARKAGVKLSEWMRQALNKEALI